MKVFEPRYLLIGALLLSCTSSAESPESPVITESLDNIEITEQPRSTVSNERTVINEGAVIKEWSVIKEWKVPWKNSLPRDPWVENAGTIWFVGQKADYVATFNPADGEFKRYDLDAGTGPHTVIVDKRGAWYAGNTASHVGLLNPQTGAVEKFVLPGDGPGDVHTMDFTSTGDIWFTVQGGNQIGLLKGDSKKITLHDVPTKHARPYGLLVDRNDKPWVALFGTNKLATVEDNRVVEITLPRAENRPRRLAISPDGMVWYVDYAEGHLGRYNPMTGSIDEWRMPGKEKSRPYAVAADKRGVIWIVETGPQPNRLVSFDPQTQSFGTPVEIPSGGGAVRNMMYDAKENSLWFGTDTDTIGRARLPSAD